jgi:hypothetical protein
MRWLCLFIGGALLTAVGLISVGLWEEIVDRKSQRLQHRQIATGMSLGEVETILGGKGKPQVLFSRPPDCFKHRWEDPYTTIDISFQAPSGAARGAAAVCGVEVQVKNPPDFTTIRTTCTILLLSTLLGFVFVVCGLWPRKPGESLNPSFPIDRPMPIHTSEQ